MIWAKYALAAAGLVVVGVAGTQDEPAPEVALLAVEAKLVAPETLEVWPGRIEREDGTLVPIPKGWTAIKTAVFESDYGATLNMHGIHDGVSVQVGENYRKNEVVRDETINVELVGDGTFSMRWLYMGGKGGGWDRFAVKNCAWRCRGISRPIQTVESLFKGGELGFYNSTFETDYSVQFVIRTYGVRVVARGNTAPGPAQEHFIYTQNMKGGADILNNVVSGMGRTAFQITNRAYKPNPPGDGPVYIAGNILTNCGAPDGGGSAITYAGHGGPIFDGMMPNGRIRPNQIYNTKGKGGGWVAYYDRKLQQTKYPWMQGAQNQGPIIGPGVVYEPQFDEEGAFIPWSGWAGPLFVMYYPGFDMLSDRNIVQIGGFKRVRIFSNPRGITNGSANRTCFDLKHNKANGSIELVGVQPPSKWPYETYTNPPQTWREGKTNIDPDIYWVPWDQWYEEEE